MHTKMIRFSLSFILLFLASLSVWAVEIKEDYYPLAAGNRWHYTSAELIDGYPITSEIAVFENDDTSLMVSEFLSHPLMVFLPVQPQIVTSDDSGSIRGLREDSGLFRHFYYDGMTFEDNKTSSPIFSIDTLYMDSDDSLYTHVWGGTNSASLSKIIDEGVGMIGYELDLTTEEYPDVAHGGYQLDSVLLVPKPSVTDAGDALLFMPADSSIEVTKVGDSSIDLSYTTNIGLSDQMILSSSYDEPANLLRIWLADTTSYDDSVIILFDSLQPDILPVLHSAGGSLMHTLRVENTDFTKDLQVKIIYREQPFGFPSQVVIYDELLEISGTTPVHPTSKRVAKSSQLSVQGTHFYAPTAGNYTVSLYNLPGRLISRGVHSVTSVGMVNWNRQGLTSGVYLIRVEAEGLVGAGKVSF